MKKKARLVQKPAFLSVSAIRPLSSPLAGAAAAAGALAGSGSSTLSGWVCGGYQTPASAQPCEVTLSFSGKGPEDMRSTGTRMATDL